MNDAQLHATVRLMRAATYIRLALFLPLVVPYLAQHVGYKSIILAGSLAIAGYHYVLFLSVVLISTRKWNGTRLLSLLAALPPLFTFFWYILPVHTIIVALQNGDDFSRFVDAYAVTLRPGVFSLVGSMCLFAGYCYVALTIIGLASLIYLRVITYPLDMAPVDGQATQPRVYRICCVISCIALLVLASRIDWEGNDARGEEYLQRIRPECLIDGKVTVLIADRVFQIPHSLTGVKGVHPGNKSYTQPYGRKYDRVCVSAGAEPTRTGALDLNTAPASERTAGDPDFTATILIRAKDNGPSKELYDALPASVRNGAEGAVVDRGYHTNASDASPNDVYLSADKEFVTPRGTPMAFKCKPDRKRGGRQCLTHFMWSDQVSVEYSFNDRDYSIDGWKPLHERVLRFLHELDTSD